MLPSTVHARSLIGVFYMGDILLEILGYLPLKDLLQYSQVHRDGRAPVRTVLRLRFKSAIRRYVDAEVLAFIDLMDEAGAVISGSTAVWMALAPTCDFRPKDLNVAVPKNKGDAVIDFFNRLGYTGASGVVEPVMTRGVRFVTHLESKGRKVTVIESTTPSPFTPVISSHNTSQMNIATPHEILIMYPHLTLSSTAHVGIVPSLQGHSCYKRSAGIRMLVTEELKQPCGASCPALFRRVNGVDDMLRASISEDSSKVSGLVMVAKAFPQKWRIQKLCHNRVCLVAHVQRMTGLVY